MKLLEALALASTTEGVLGVATPEMKEENMFWYKRDGVLYEGYNNVLDPEEDYEEVTITLRMLEDDTFELVMAPQDVIKFTEAQFIAAWDNAVRRALPNLAPFQTSQIGKATLNSLKQLYTTRV